MNFADFEIAYAGKFYGIAVSPSRDILALLRRSNDSSAWSFTEFALTDLRSVRKVVTEPEEFFGGGHRGAYGIGQSIGLAVRNRNARKNAEANTGIEINLRSVDMPTAFIPINDERDRDRLFEALSQVCESGTINGRVNNISPARAKVMQENFVSPDSVGDPARKYIPKESRNGSDHGVSNKTVFKLITAIVVASAALIFLVGPH